MACIKTGAQVYLAQYGRYMICDIHEFSNGLWVLRGSGESLSPSRDKLHATIIDVAQDWQTDTNGVATHVVEPDNYTYYGYDGVPCVKP